MKNKKSWAVTVTDESTMIAPAQSGYEVTTAEAGAVSAGGYYQMPNGRVYWTPDGGTLVLANAPTHGYGMVTSADSIQWLAILGSRSSLIICADEAAVTYLSEGATAVVSEGIILDDLRPWIQFGNYSGAVYGIVSSGTATITVQER